MTLRSIPDRFIPHFCVHCGAPMKQDPEIWNHFICTSDPDDRRHDAWPQSPHVSYVIPVDEEGCTYLIRRGIPPAIGGLCFPGGYDDFGDTGEETVIHEAQEEAQISLLYARDQMIYLGEWHELTGVTVRAFLARIHTINVAKFVPSNEATERIRIPINELKPEDLAFPGNRAALTRAIRPGQLRQLL